MDYNSWTFTFVLLYLLWRYGASHKLQSPRNVSVVLRDGEVTLVWVHPAQAPSEAYYKVQLTKYSRVSNWTTVPGCEQVLSTHCDLTYFTTSKDLYWARVQMVKGEMTSQWSKSKRFCRQDSELLPPTFTLSSSSTSVKVTVHRSQALKDTFPHRLFYTYHLQEKVQDNAVNKTFVWERTTEEENDVEFDYLTWGHEYCVHVEVEHFTGIAKSVSSPDQCVLLPQPGWYTAAIVVAISVSSVGVLGLLSLLLYCFLWWPKALPSTLKSPRSAWHPLILGDVPVEKVTDQGWFLISQKKSGEQGVKRKVMEEEEGQMRRGSMDSGVSVDQSPSEKGGGGEGDGGDGRKQEDSGCGSLGETDGDSDSSSSSRRASEERPLLDGRNHGGDSPQKEDSGLGLGCGIRYSDMRKEDCELLPVEAVETGDGYRSQRPSFVVVQEVEREKPSEGITGETDTSIAITVGYRPSQFSCVCQGKGLCLWCQSVTPLPTKEHSVSSYPTADHSDQLPSFSVTCIPDSYLRKTSPHNGGDLVHRDTSFVCHIPQISSNESDPLLISVPQLPLVCGVLESSVNALSLSLRDVELTFG
ncbi:interleukin-10 receptor subunit alpha [Anguilla rostrata]|uniref:interleukin-10 receptor subunit alpha n=1 Tax=Anguilla rostrata TaxID=7938 RepID=UPI0030D464CF